MDDLSVILPTFLQTLDSQEKLRSFLSFGAGHPELSLDNCCLFYLQAPGAGRYAVHRGLADHYQYPRAHPVGLFGLDFQESRILHKNLVLYPVPEYLVKEEAQPDISLRAILSRIHYSLIPDPSVSDWREDKKEQRIVYPGSWREEEKSAAFLPLFVDCFWKRIRERGELPLAVTDRDFLQYRRALLFMASRLVGREDGVLPATFLRFVCDASPSALFPLTLGMVRMYTLWMLFTELDQAMEGLHFTLYESLLFRREGADPDPARFRPGMVPMDVYLACMAFRARYAGDTFLRTVPRESVHIYPPFRVPSPMF